MYDLSDIKSFKKKAEDNKEKLAGNYDDEYNQGLNYLKEFGKAQDIEILTLATEKFFNCLKFKRTSVEPYFYISYISFISGEKELAIKYFEFAEEVDINYPHLDGLCELIKSN
jgi:hypothetical protein